MRIYLLIFRGEGKETERERNINVYFPHVLPFLGPDLACNPGMCLDWESNQQPFGAQAHTQSTELHQPGHVCLLETLNSLRFCIALAVVAKGILLFLVQQRRHLFKWRVSLLCKCIFTKSNFDLVFKVSPHLLFLKINQPKIIFMPNRHMWGSFQEAWIKKNWKQEDENFVIADQLSRKEFLLLF